MLLKNIQKFMYNVGVLIYIYVCVCVCMCAFSIIYQRWHNKGSWNPARKTRARLLYIARASAAMSLAHSPGILSQHQRGQWVGVTSNCGTNILNTKWRPRINSGPRTWPSWYGSLRHQAICSPDIDYSGLTVPCLPSNRISTTCAI